MRAGEAKAECGSCCHFLSVAAISIRTFLCHPALAEIVLVVENYPRLLISGRLFDNRQRNPEVE